MMITLIHTER